MYYYIMDIAIKNLFYAIPDFWHFNLCLSDAVICRKSPETAGGETAENTGISKLAKSRLQIIISCFLLEIRTPTSYETAVALKPRRKRYPLFWRLYANPATLKNKRRVC